MSSMQSTSPPEPRDGFKETLEPIVVALILAFVFRAFVVEAFVIPTGSMAPTLYGAHGTIVCADCGTEFAYGLRDPDDNRASVRVSSSARAVCPNCDHANGDLYVNDVRQNPETGDRILVLKWPFDIGGDLLGPARWDVVVFKDPADGETNFIKRLVGLPEEVLMILDGDVYFAPISVLSARALATLDAIRHEKYLMRTKQKEGRLPPTPLDVLDELDGELRLARKSPAAQRALWFTVYDHDYSPQTPDPDQPYWSAFHGSASGWDVSAPRVRFEDSGLDNDRLELKGKAILATCAYNIYNRSGPPGVTDQRLRFVLTPGTTRGEVSVRLSKMGRSFIGTVGMDGRVAIREDNEGRRYQEDLLLETTLPPLVPGESIEISFENVDYRLSLYVKGKAVLSTSDDRDSPSYYGPDIRRLRFLQAPWPADPPQIGAKDGRFELTHVVVERDVYYYSHPDRRALALPWAPPTGWASPASPILLRKQEYFMLGDNTAASKDSRLWDLVDERFADRGEQFQLGTVPRDQLIGKAFFVYWPSPNRLSWMEWLPVVKGGLVPDVGRMRWIR